MSKKLGNTLTQQTWDEADGLPLLIQDGTTSYITGPAGLPLEQITSKGTVYYYHQDQLGSTRDLTDAKGAIKDSYAYDAYGIVASSKVTVTNPFLFAGQYQDSESGFYYLRSRYYDPSTGQFITRDALASATREPYSYVADNPLNVVDPAGRCVGPAFLACVGIGLILIVSGAAAVLVGGSGRNSSAPCLDPSTDPSCVSAALNNAWPHNPPIVGPNAVNQNPSPPLAQTSSTPVGGVVCQSDGRCWVRNAQISSCSQESTWSLIPAIGREYGWSGS